MATTALVLLVIVTGLQLVLLAAAGVLYDDLNALRREFYALERKVDR